MLHFVQTAVLLIFPALVIVGALRDATSFTIPNWISLILVVAFPAAAFALGLPAAGLGGHLLTGFVALTVGVGMFAAGWIGGGDAKLFAASALWLGPAAMLPFILWIGLVGGLLTFSLLTLRAPRFRPFALGGPPWLVRLADPDEGLPYGVAIAAGALIALPTSGLVVALA